MLTSNNSKSNGTATSIEHYTHTHIHTHTHTHTPLACVKYITECDRDLLIGEDVSDGFVA